MIRVERSPSGSQLADAAQMVRDLVRDSGTERFWAINEPDLAAFIQNCNYRGVAVDNGGSTVGCLLGFVGPCPFNAVVKVAREVILWVLPKARGQHAGAQLVNDFSAWAQEAGASFVSIGSTFGFGEKHIRRIADATGFDLLETMYLRRV